jgi:hypothetical protein
MEKNCFAKNPVRSIFSDGGLHVREKLNQNGSPIL